MPAFSKVSLKIWSRPSRAAARIFWASSSVTSFETPAEESLTSRIQSFLNATSPGSSMTLV